MHHRDDDIYASTSLRQLRSEQTRALTPELQRCFGTHGLLLGVSPHDAPPTLPMLGCWTTLHLCNGRYAGDLQADADEPLPFVDDAFELVLLPHILEVTPTAAALLAESIRVLAPGGMLVLTGVHPLSAWSPWLHWRARDRALALHLPWRLSRNLQSAGLDIEWVRRIGRFWPGLAVMQGAPANVFGGGYVLIARKRRRMVAPLRIKSTPVRMPANGRLSPGTRRSSAL
ncbi:class I SAM-dependent methyltransferase [Rhodanobacter sp. Col0626]|uniref:class I SAM-dependent methyltransferase n=1 Tax=Rhodanobacter sp. Col0626 TaxID=3415679 RepID=UPI003CF5042A